MSFIRSFIAIEIENEETLKKIIKLKHDLENLGLDGKFVEDENIHLTIRFLGEVAISTIEQIKEVLNYVTSVIKPFEIRIAGLGAFPNTHRPRVIWVGIISGFEKLAGIRRIIDSEIVKRGLKDVQRDRHEFSPHITIARLKSYKNLERLKQQFLKYENYEFGVTEVTQIKLKKSTLTPSGPIYSDIYIARLQKPI
jgi:2'-5' RNA ligase